MTNISFSDWSAYFHANRKRQLEIEAQIDWRAPTSLPAAQRDALVRSFQRFHLGENGDGHRLLAKAHRAGDKDYCEALALLVAEEQRHSALFLRGLRHMGALPLAAHWSDAAFTLLRRALGLRTEIALFLIAETVAMDYFDAVAGAAPDPVLRGIGERIRTDEVEHIRFQIDRLRVGFAHLPAGVRGLVGVAWGVVAAGAALVLVADHRHALRACGLSPLRYWGRAMRRFRMSAAAALNGTDALLGPTAALDHWRLREGSAAGAPIGAE